MRSTIAVIAGLAAFANAQAYPYPVNATSTPPPAKYSTPVPVYPVSSAPAPYVTTSVVYGISTYCAGPTTLTYGQKTYTVKYATTLIDTSCSYTTTYKVTPPCPTPTPVKPTSTPCPPPAYTPVAPPKYSTPAPPKNVTYPTASKPAPPAQWTGAANAQAGVGFMAVVGAVAAFL